MKTRFAPVLYLGLVMTAAAQDQEIVVTATKDPAPPADLTVPVIVVKPAQEATVAELVARVPGLAVSGATPGLASVGAAGFGDNAYGRLNLLLDGTALNRPDQAAPVLNLVPLVAIDKVELVTGPVSALYGDQASGGALNLVTREPTRPELILRAQVEGNGGHTESLFGGGPWGPGSWAAAVQQMASRPTRDRSASDEWTGWAQLVLRPGEGQQLHLSASAADGTYQLPGGLTRSLYEADPDQAVNPDDQARQTTAVASFRWESSGDRWTWVLPWGGTWRSVDYHNSTFANFTQSGLGLADLEPRLSWTDPDVAGGELTL